MKLLGHVFGHMLDHVLDQMLDCMIIGFITTVLQSSINIL